MGDILNLIINSISSAVYLGYVSTDICVQELNTSYSNVRPGIPPEIPDDIISNLKLDGYIINTYTACFGFSSNCDFGCICPKTIPTNIIVSWEKAPPKTPASKTKHKSYTSKIRIAEREIQDLKRRINEYSEVLRNME